VTHQLLGYILGLIHKCFNRKNTDFLRDIFMMKQLKILNFDRLQKKYLTLQYIIYQ